MNKLSFTSLRGLSNGWLLAVASALVVAVGCSSSSSGGGGGTGGGGGGTDPTVTAADCKSSCDSKAMTCGYTAAMYDSACTSICSSTATKSMLTCLTAKSCADLANAQKKGLAAVCPPAGSTAGDAGGGGGGGAAQAGDSCTCSGGGGTSGRFDCTGGATTCVDPLHCNGFTDQGTQKGTCVAQCCDSTADCAAKLGAQSNCPSGDSCNCPFGGFICTGSGASIKCGCGTDSSSTTPYGVCDKGTPAR